MIRRAVAGLAGGCALAACGLSIEGGVVPVGNDASTVPESGVVPVEAGPIEAGVIEAGVSACVKRSCAGVSTGCWADDCSSDTRWADYNQATPRSSGVCEMKVPNGTHTGRNVATESEAPDDLRFDLYFEITSYRTPPGASPMNVASVGTSSAARFTWVAVSETKVALCQSGGCVEKTVTRLPQRFHYYGTIDRRGAGGTVIVEDADDPACAKLVEATVTGSFPDGAWYAYIGCLGAAGCDFTWDNAVFELR